MTKLSAIHDILLDISKDSKFDNEYIRLHNIFVKLSQLNSPFAVENAPPYNLKTKYKDIEEDLEQRDEQRSKQPRYMPHEYYTIPGSQDSKEDTGNSEGITPFNMNGENEVTGPAQISIDSSPSMRGGVEEFSYENRDKDIEQDPSKRYLMRN